MLKNLFKKTAIVFALLSLGSITHAADTVYNRGNSGEPLSLDPHQMSTVQESHVGRDMFEGLVQYDPQGNAIPGSAESWTVSSDGKVYTFKMRANAKWSNGDPVTADDFVYSLRRMETPATGAKYASILYPIQNAEDVNSGKMKPEELGVRAIDKGTLEITLRAPTPYFIDMITHTAAFPVHRASIEKFGGDWVKPGNLVSNGAYVPSEFIPKDHITLVKNKNYYDADKVKIETVKYIPIEDRSAALKRFEAGEIDNYDQFPVELMAHIRADLKGQFFTGPYLGLYSYYVRVNKKPLDDPKLRRALALAVDREYLAEKIFDGTFIPAYSYVPPGIKGYNTSYVDYKDRQQLDREDEARKIMTELGYSKDKPLKVEIRYNTGEEHKNCAVAVADMWKNIFVETTFLNSDVKTHYSYLTEKGDFDLARIGWIADFKDPQTFLGVIQTGDGNNYSMMSNPELDGWLKKAETEQDQAKRYDALSKAEAVGERETPIIQLLYYSYHNLVAKRLKGFEQNIMDVHPTKWMSLDGSHT